MSTGSDPRTATHSSMPGVFAPLRQNGAITSANYKRCMLAQGWRYRSTARVRTYIDPDTGMNCRDEGGGAAICEPPQGTVHYFDPDQGLPCTRTGIVSVCSNIQ